MTVTEICSRAMGYANLLIGDTMPAGATRSLVDAIGGAVSEMADAAPGYFQTRVGGVFAAPATVSITINGSDPTAATAATSGIVRVLGTVRLPGAAQDFQAAAYSHPNLTLAPGWEGELGVTLSATAYHDAVSISSSIRIDDNTKVIAGGAELTRVADKQAARELLGKDADGLDLLTGTLGTDAHPSAWWIERNDTATFLKVYPLPAVKSAYAVIGTRAIASLSPAAVLTSEETFGLEPAVARDILVPLALQRWCASPLMANSVVREEIARQAAAALQKLQRLGPKKAHMAPWNDTRRRPLHSW